MMFTAAWPLLMSTFASEPLADSKKFLGMGSVGTFRGASFNRAFDRECCMHLT